MKTNCSTPFTVGESRPDFKCRGMFWETARETHAQLRQYRGYWLVVSHMAGNIYRGSPASGIENDEEFSFSSWIESSKLEDGHENNVRYSTGENISSDFLLLSLPDSVSDSKS